MITLGVVAGCGDADEDPGIADTSTSAGDASTSIDDSSASTSSEDASASTSTDDASTSTSTDDASTSTDDASTSSEDASASADSDVEDTSADAPADGEVCGDACPPAMLRGINIAGAEFGAAELPGTHLTDYIWPTLANGYDVSYYTDKGMNVIRLPFLWERLQPTLRGPFDVTENARLTAAVAEFEATGATVVLDPHNYARYRGAILNESDVTSADLADLWARLATLFADDPQVVFGLMNEPREMDTGSWVEAANAALVAIRDAGADNLVLVPGNHWTGAWSWDAAWIAEDQRNSVRMLDIVDPGDHLAFEVHQYLDNDYSGTLPGCQSATVGSQAMATLTAWLRTHGRRAFVGELGAGSDDTCLAALADLVGHIEANADVYIGWAYWAGGPWWGTYFTSLEPTDAVDKPQMDVLEAFLP
ncbi:MAG: cellulase family glycosylhydrolase [Deltaproteobacteria bacterium]|nr:cellulase family glycosylhydrolase [Deltaproteobacteria bacterium]